MQDRINKIIPYIIPVFGIGIIVLYYFVDPSASTFPIKCIWRDLTGTSCPSCGTQRALHSLSNGQIVEALSYNLFFVISVPYAVLLIISTWYNFNNYFTRLKEILLHSRTLIIYVYMYFGWWLIRNLLNI